MSKRNDRVDKVVEEMEVWKWVRVEITQGSGAQHQHVRDSDARGLPEFAVAHSLLLYFVLSSLKEAWQGGPQSDKEHSKRHKNEEKLVLFNQRDHAGQQQQQKRK